MQTMSNTLRIGPCHCWICMTYQLVFVLMNLIKKKHLALSFQVVVSQADHLKNLELNKGDRIVQKSALT